MLRSVILILTLLSSGCESVYTAQPVGEKPYDLSEEKEKWEGTWAHGNGAITVAVVDAARGKLQAGWLEKSGDTLRPEIYDIELRASGKWTFANVKDPERPRYILLRVQREDRQISLFSPDHKKWRDLIAGKKIPGTLKQLKKSDGKTETEVTAGPLAAKDIGYIMADERATLFRQPTALVKITK